MPPKNNSKQTRETLYNNLRNDGYRLGSYDEFEAKLKDSRKRRKLYNNLLSDGYKMDDYDTFIGVLGFAAPEHTVLTKVADKVKEVGSTIGANLKETAKSVAQVPKQIAQAYKELGTPETEEEVFEFVHHPTLAKLAEETEQAFIKSDEYKELSKAIAAAPINKRQHLIDQLQTAYMNSSGVASYGKEVERMALEYEAAKNPMLKVQLITDELQQLRKQIEPTEALGKLVGNPELYPNQIEFARENSKYEERVKAEAAVRGRIDQLNRELSAPLGAIADEGLNRLAQVEKELYRTIEQDIQNDALNIWKPRQYDDRVRAISSSKRILNNLKDIAAADTKNGFKSLWQGISNNDFLDLLSLGMKGLGENFDLAGIAKRASRGEAISEEERFALETYGLYQNLANQKELPVTYGIGQSFIQSLPFMVEIFATGGLRSAVGKGVSGALSKRVAASLPKLSPKLTSAIAKGTGYAAGTLAAVPVTPMTYKTASERQLGNYHIDMEGNVQQSEQAESLPESLGWAGLSTFITLAAEDGVGAFAQGMKYTGKGVGKALGLTKRVKANSKLGSYIKSVQKHTRWNGFLQEIGEEYDEALLTNLLVPATAVEQDVMEQNGTSRWDDFFDPKKALEIIGSIGLTQILMSAPVKVNGYYQSGKAKADLKKAQSDLPESISRRMVEAMNLPDFEQQQQAIEGIDFSRLQDDEVLAVQKYILSKNRYDILKGRDEGLTQSELTENIRKQVGSVTNGKEAVTIATDRYGNQHYVVSDSGSDAVIVKDGEGNTGMIARSDLVETQEYSASELVAQLEEEAVSQLEQENEATDQQEVAEEVEETPAIEEEQPAAKQYAFGDMVTAKGKQYTIGNQLDEGSWMAQDEAGRDVVLSAAEIEQGRKAVPEEANQPDVTLKIDDRQAVGVVQHENGTAELDKPFTSEKEARATADKLNERYPNSTFEVENRTDANNPFAEASFVVKATPKTAIKQQEVEQSTTKSEQAVVEQNDEGFDSLFPEVSHEQLGEHTNLNEEDIEGQVQPAKIAEAEQPEIEQNQEQITNKNTTFERETTSENKPLDNSGLSDIVSSDEELNSDNNEATTIPNTIRQDTAELDDREQPRTSDRNDGEERAETLSEQGSGTGIRAGRTADEGRTVRDRSTGNSNEQDSPTIRPRRNGVGNGRDGDRAGRSRANDRRTARAAGGTSASSDLLNQRNYAIEDASSIVPKGEIAKLKANLEAIKLLKQLEQDVREATDEEKKILSQYSGWGGLAEVLNKSRRRDENWVKKYKTYHDQLIELLTPEEYDYAVNSTINAHYTSGTIVSELWKLAEHLGFNGGTVLEPAVGTGNFFGLMPKHLSEKSALRAYELDSITGRIAAKLYPDAHVKVIGYESSTDRGIDLIITNVPFGQLAPYDKNNKDISKFSLHNYFIAKGIRQLAPNGIGIFISSASTMDGGASAQFRQWAVTEGNSDFIGAIRLPNTAFSENAGTTVTTDVLIFRKRDSDKPSPYAKLFRYTVPFKETVDDKGEPFSLEVNEYYAQNPTMMLGEMMLAHESTGAKAGGLYSANDATLVPHKGQDLQEAIATAISQLPQNISAIANAPTILQAADTTAKEGTLVEKDGNIYEVDNGMLVAPEWVGKTINNLKKKKVPIEQLAKEYLAIKGIGNQLVEAEREGKNNIEELRAELNRTYDAFVKEYGRFNENHRTRFLVDSDVDYNTVFALEMVNKTISADENGNTKRNVEIVKSDIFSKRILFPVQEPTVAENIQDAVEISIAYRGSLDLAYMAELTDSTPEAVKEEMLNMGLGFINPDSGLLEDRDSYLSGYVRTKYRQAQAAAESNPEFEANVRALKEVQPADIPATQIKVRLGSPFVNKRFIEAFAYDKLKIVAKIQYSKALASWVVDVQSGKGSAENTTTYGTERITAMSLLEKGLNLKQPEIFDSYRENGKTVRVKNLDATAEAQTALFNLANEFENYIAENEEAMAQIERDYNEQYNDFVEKTYSVPGIKHYPNANPDITLRQHQKVAVSRGLKGSLLLAHQVGTGKTFTMQTIAMEMRRLGIAKKPMIVVQNATLEQFALSFNQLYPSAKILAPTKKMMNAKNRQRLFSLIAYGDYDAIIIPQSFVDMIPDNEDRVRGYIQEQIAELQRVLVELEDGENDSLQKELQDALEKLEEELDSVGEPKIKKKKGSKVKDQAKRQLGVTKRVLSQADRRTDNVLTFEQMGIDALLVDEAHAYKKLGFFTKMSRIKGIDTGRSKRAFGMYLKTQFVQERSGGNNVIFATGTPITNTMAELWTMMKFISPDVLKRYSITSFDEFASTFGSVEPSLEFTSTGSFKIVERFKSYINAPELLTAFRIKTHVVLTEDIPEFKEGNTIPKLKNNEFTKVIIPQSEGLEATMAKLKQDLEEWENLKPREKRKKRHVPLVIFNQAKQAAIDLRLLDLSNEDDAGSKTNRVVKEVKRIYDASTKYKGTQLVFSDMFQSPDGKGSRRFNLYENIREKLISLGIPEKEIAIIHDYEDEKRELLFKQLNSGDVRILLGSTERMGVGVNVQERLAALHHIDAPPRPMDFEQRNGRIQRQGNIHALMGIPIEVVTYGVEKTLDATAYQRLAIKQKFINQMMKGENLDREMEDGADEDSPTDMTFDQMMSTLSGSQYAVLHVQKSFELKKLETAERNFRRRQVELNKTIKQDEETIISSEKALSRANRAMELIKEYFPDEKISSVTIKGVTYDEKIYTAVDEAIDRYIQAVVKSGVLRYSDAAPFEIGLNEFSEPVKITLENAINKEFGYVLNVGGYELKQNEIHSGQGLITSIRSKLMSVEGASISIQQRVRDAQTRIPILKLELNKTFDKQGKLEELTKEVKELEELMQQETGGKSSTSKQDLAETDDIDEIATPPIAEEEEEPENTDTPVTTAEAEAAETASRSELVKAVEPFIHTKTNKELAVAKLAKEVDRNSYFAISTIAKQHSGSWSRFAKGFLFDSAEDANAFRDEVNRTENVEGFKPVQFGMPSLEGVAKLIGLEKGSRPLDVRGGAILHKFADREIYIKSLQSKIKQLGGKVSDKSDVYNDMTLSIGRSTDRIVQYENNEFKSLVDTAHKVVDTVGSEWSWSKRKHYNGKPITGYDALELYLRAKDIVEAQEQGYKDRGRAGFEASLGISPEAFVMDYELRLGEELTRELWATLRIATNFSINTLAEMGSITKEELEEYKNRKFYVPQRGWKNRDLDSTIYKYIKHVGGQFYDDGYNLATIVSEGRSSLSSNPLPYIQSMAHTSVVISEKHRYKKKVLKLVTDNLDLGRAHKLFDLKRTWYVSIKDSEGNPVKDSSGNVIREEVVRQPAQVLFAEDAVIRQEISKLNAELVEARKRNDWERIDELKEAIGWIKDRINVETHYSNAYTSQRTDDELAQHEVRIWHDNQQYVIIFDDERVSNAVNKADYESVSGYLQNWFGKGTRWLAAVNTSKNPSFAVFNFMRDFGFANLTHLLDNGLAYGGKFNRNVFNPKLHAAIFREVTTSKDRSTKYDALLRQFFEDGAATGYAFLKDLDQLKRNIEKEFTPKQGNSPVRWTKKGFSLIPKAFAAITEYSELITRFATYATSIEVGRSRHQAAVDAKNVTVNFNRKGTLSPMMNMFYMFFNATIQGGMRAADVAIRHKGKFAAAAASLYLLGFLNTLFTMPDGDDDENRKFSEFDRKQNIIIGGVKIPLPHFFRAFWGAGVHSALAIKGKKEALEAGFDSFRDLGNEFVLEQFNLLSYMKYNQKSKAAEFDSEAIVNLLPSMLKPFGEIAINKDFTGRSIYKRPYVNADKIPKAFWSKPDIGNVWQELSYLMLEAGGGDREIRKLYSTETGSYISDWFNVNPEALEHLFTAYTGGVGRFFNDSYKTLNNAANGEFDATVVPVLNRFVKQYDEDKAFLKDYYTLTDRIRDIEFARDATKKAIIGKNGQRYDKALEEYKQLISSERYTTAMKAKIHLKTTMDKLNKILGKLDEEKDQNVVLELKAEHTRLMKLAKGYLEEMK